jgi:VIT1/CCC1 family predicted Fe2+/Mn2+ transporter
LLVEACGRTTAAIRSHVMTEGAREPNRLLRIGWLRAAVLGANDGIVSTASVVLGVASSNASHGSVATAAIAALVGGAMSMATGEYVSVSSQADTERAALDRERTELATDRAGELRELTAIYVKRGLEPPLARRVAERLTARDPLGAHARDELGISEIATAHPLQAALASASSFSAGAALPLLVTLLVPHAWLGMSVASSAIVALAVLGGLAARAGGAPLARGVLRVTFWSALAMGVTAAAGAWFGATA